MYMQYINVCLYVGTYVDIYTYNIDIDGVYFVAISAYTYVHIHIITNTYT